MYLITVDFPCESALPLVNSSASRENPEGAGQVPPQELGAPRALASALSRPRAAHAAALPPFLDEAPGHRGPRRRARGQARPELGLELALLLA